MDSYIVSRIALFLTAINEPLAIANLIICSLAVGNCCVS